MIETTRHLPPAAGRTLGLSAALAALVMDQSTKWLVAEVVMVPPRVLELTPFLNLVLGRNPGVTFGLFAGHGDVGRWVLTAVALMIVAALGVWLWRTRQRLTAGALGLIIGGALGNVADRVRVGAVTDFIDLHVAGYHWPAFNLADAAVVAGLAILVFEEQLASRRARRR